jgi:uncharacterized protein HemY
MVSEKIERIKKILLMEPESELLWYSLGQEYMSHGMHAEAVEALEKAISIKPDYTAVYESLGRALEKAGRIEDAKGIYRKGIEVGGRTRDMIPYERMSDRLNRLEKGPGSGTKPSS